MNIFVLKVRGPLVQGRARTALCARGLAGLDLVRIGDKIVSRGKIYRAIDRVLELRAAGLAQQETAAQVGIDRSFVSRVEAMGIVRRGQRIALIGFPVQNKEELRELALAEGLDLVLLLNDEERWRYVREKSGEVLVNQLMDLIGAARQYDAVVFIGSDMRLRLVEAILGTKVVGLVIGNSPIKEDKYVNPGELREIIRQLKSE